MFQGLLSKEVYFETFKRRVPRELKPWHVRNFMIVRLPAPPSQQQVAFLANAPPTRLFDRPTWQACEAIPDLVSSLAGYHPARLAEECRSKAATAPSPLVRIERLRLELGLERAASNCYAAEKAGKLLELAVDHWPRHDLPALLEDALPDFLGIGRNWKNRAKVVKVARSWPPEAQANLARAYLAIGEVQVADGILKIED